MNILLIHQFYLEKDDPGGSRFNEMTKVWVKEGHQVTVIAGMVNYVTGKVPAKYHRKKYNLTHYQESLSVLRCYVSPDYNANFLGRLFAYFSFAWYGFWGVILKLRSQKFDVIVATSPPLFVGGLAILVSWVKSVPYLFEVRDLWPESAIETGVLKNRLIIKISFWVESLIYRRAFAINVLTPAFKTKLIDNKKVPSGKILFIPNAADFSLSDSLLENPNSASLREKLGWKNRFVVTYVGAHGVANHLIQILNAASLADPSVLFVLIGDGMQKPDLKKIAMDRKLSNVQFIDSVPKQEVFQFILASDVGLSVLKKIETFKTIYSNKTFDYMACKKPILIAIDGVSRALMETAKCGLYAEPENAEELVRQINFLEANPTICNQMGENGYRFAKQHFDRNVLAKQYLDEIADRLKHV